jgi:hypothetical protein
VNALDSPAQARFELEHKELLMMVARAALLAGSPAEKWRVKVASGWMEEEEFNAPDLPGIVKLEHEELPMEVSRKALSVPGLPEKCLAK